MKERYFSTFQLILLALFAALIVVAKIALRLPLQLPGHSGIFWMAIVIVAAGVVPKVGAASLVGLTSGVLAAFLGLGDFGALNTFLSYTMVGVGTDLALLFLGRNPENLIVATIVATFGHFCKFLGQRHYCPSFFFRCSTKPPNKLCIPSLLGSRSITLYFLF